MIPEVREVIAAGEYVRDGYDFLYNADNQGFVTIVGVDLDGKRSGRIGGSLAGTLQLFAGEIIAARLLNVSARTVRYASKVRDDGADELHVLNTCS